MSDIVLATVNAGYAHASLGLRSLRANLGPLRERSAIVEADGHAAPETVADRILAAQPVLCGLGVTIWNVDVLTRVAEALKAARPDLLLILGGPEVSHGTDGLRLAELADCVVAGEAEHAFCDLSEGALAGRRPPPLVRAEAPDPATLAPADAEFTAEDLAHRIAYAESARGCPHGCEYCLSAVDRRVRPWPLDAVLASWGRLLDRGARRIKIVDRTFNLDAARAAALLRFLAGRLPPDGVAQVEMTPVAPPAVLVDAFRAFRPGALRAEVGVQTFTPDVAARIGRRADDGGAAAMIGALRAAGAVVHADLIAGLPGETPASFAAGFDRLLALGPDEIQVGILKRLRGAPIARHDAEWGMRYAEAAPYEVQETRTWPSGALDATRRFARYWEATHNRGRFRTALPMLWEDGASPFASFAALSEGLHAQLGRAHALDPEVLARLLFDHLTGARGIPPARAAAALLDDRRPTPARPPRWLREVMNDEG
jgi:radical SAM superfamily enzyme YgiQ (UPF0313 family)